MSRDDRAAPILLVTHPDEGHVFDVYIEEILLTEGYNTYEKSNSASALTAQDLLKHPLVLVSSGAARRMDLSVVEQYASAGGNVIAFRPPREWGALFGLGQVGQTYTIAADAYVRVNAEHPWMRGFPSPDLQCLGENHVYPNESAETLVYTAGQLGEPSVFPAVALKRIGAGAGVVFTYDLAESVVLAHQGRPENASTGSNPDANRDGKYAPDDALEGMRDFRLRHVPQADRHQDILVRAIVGLTRDRMPLPRLWHFPKAAPAVFFVNGDGDGMTWDDLEWTLRTADEFGVKYTLYMMTEQIEAFGPEAVESVRRRGHDFGPHPWVSMKPSVGEWRTEVAQIVSRMREKFGFQPASVRSHCMIFPGWDDTPRILAANGLRLDTTYAGGYRYVSGYMNGSGLPVKFMGRDGAIIDCYEQCTMQTEDGTCTPKCLLPVLSEDEAIAVSLELIRLSAEAYHGVYHPYFHPINLGGRGAVACRRWFREVLRAVHDRGLPSVSGREWLAFNDARRAVGVQQVTWEPGEGDLCFDLYAPRAVEGLTILVPPSAGMSPVDATAAAERVDLVPVPYEGLGWSALQVSLRADERVTIAVSYGRD
ncbi:MAG: hypothetical protein ACE5O2_08065 [Armatimonadota bacterium]